MMTKLESGKYEEEESISGELLDELKEFKQLTHNRTYDILQMFYKS
jgi:hypothetical protein